MAAATTNRSPLVVQNVDAPLHRSSGVRKPHCDAVWSVARDLPAKILGPRVKTRSLSSGGFGNPAGRAAPPRECRDIEATARCSQFSVQNFRQLSRDARATSSSVNKGRMTRLGAASGMPFCARTKQSRPSVCSIRSWRNTRRCNKARAKTYRNASASASSRSPNASQSCRTVSGSRATPVGPLGPAGPASSGPHTLRAFETRRPPPRQWLGGLDGGSPRHQHLRRAPPPRGLQGPKAVRSEHRSRWNVRFSKLRLA